MSKSKEQVPYEECLCPVELFRYFVRKTYKDIDINNEEINAIRIEFAKHLHNLNLTETQKEKILPKSEICVMLNSDSPLMTNGFPPAYVLHFIQFVDKMKEELES